MYFFIYIYTYVLRDQLTYVVNNSKLAQMNTQRNDVGRTDGPRCDQHFQMPGHNFNALARFTIIEEVYNKPLSTLKIRGLLEHREDFWIFKLKILSPQGIHISLNCLQDTTGSIW